MWYHDAFDEGINVSAVKDIELSGILGVGLGESKLLDDGSSFIWRAEGGMG